MSATSFIDVRHVFVDYTPSKNILARLSGKQAVPHSVLRDISFQLTAGQHVVLFGAPGSGKSTLLRTLAGGLRPARGHIFVNGKEPENVASLAAGYVSAEESEPLKETVGQVLHAFASTHKLSAAPARIGVVTEALGISSLVERIAAELSTTERLKVNLARAALSHSPLLLLDDVTDQLGGDQTKQILQQLFSGRTVIAATRSVDEAQRLGLPVMILHQGKLAHFGTCDDIASSSNCPRIIRAWVEGLRYDLLRAIKKQPGVVEVRLTPTDQFEGQQLRIVVRSTRYLPALYDLISQAPLIRIDEEPVGLGEILASLS